MRFIVLCLKKETMLILFGATKAVEMYPFSIGIRLAGF